MDAADFIQYVNDNRDVLNKIENTKCEAERINEKQSFTNDCANYTLIFK